MSLGQWLNSLSAVDHGILFAIFLVGIYFSYATLEFLIEFYVLEIIPLIDDPGNTCVFNLPASTTIVPFTIT